MLIRYQHITKLFKFPFEFELPHPLPPPLQNKYINSQRNWHHSESVTKPSDFRSLAAFLHLLITAVSYGVLPNSSRLVISADCFNSSSRQVTLSIDAAICSGVYRPLAFTLGLQP